MLSTSVFFSFHPPVKAWRCLFPQEETEAPGVRSLEGAGQAGKWEPGVGTELGAWVSDAQIPPLSMVPFQCLLGSGWRLRICSEDCLCRVWLRLSLCVLAIKCAVSLCWAVCGEARAQRCPVKPLGALERPWGASRRPVRTLPGVVRHRESACLKCYCLPFM